jgi:hypothetical protein
MGANRTRFLANRRLQPLGHLSASSKGIIPEVLVTAESGKPRRHLWTGPGPIFHTQSGAEDC